MSLGLDLTSHSASVSHDTRDFGHDMTGNACTTRGDRRLFIQHDFQVKRRAWCDGCYACMYFDEHLAFEGRCRGCLADRDVVKAPTYRDGRNDKMKIKMKSFVRMLSENCDA
ncbi:hypothetical protein MRX96_036160 [Rhipicephalus microplus]